MTCPWAAPPACRQIEDSADGIQLAKDVAVRAAEGDEQEVLRLVNSPTHAQLAWAAAYFGQMMTVTFPKLPGGDADQGLAMVINACSEDEGTFDTQARLLLSEDPDGEP